MIISGQDIVCFSSIDWDYLWQVHQAVMSRLAIAGNRVTFVESTGLRTPTVRDLPRLVGRARSLGGLTRPRNPRPAGLRVVTPRVLPFPYSPAITAVNRRILRRDLAAAAGSSGTQPIVWTFLPTPLIRAVAADLNPALLIYYCVDDLPLSSTAAQRVEPSEQALFAESDLVFVTSSQLQQKALTVRRDAHLFPAGVDYEALARVRDGNQPVPRDLAGVPKPIVGYSGGRPPWVDLDLVARAARELPQASFVLVGPPTDVPELRGISNVFSLGHKSAADLPAYLRAFDVALVPYALTPYTAAIFPAKLYEYFVFGMPVVSTPLQEIVALCRDHGPVVRVAPSEEFVTAVGDAIHANGRDALTPVRQALAQANDWSGRLEAMSTLIERALSR